MFGRQSLRMLRIHPLILRVKALFQCLRDAPQLLQIFLCLDSDNAGQSAARRIQEKLKTENREAKLLVPTHKDWNEELLYEGGIQK